MGDTETTGPDGFSYTGDEPEAEAHRLLDRYLEETLRRTKEEVEPRESAAGRTILDSGTATRLAAVRAAQARAKRLPDFWEVGTDPKQQIVLKPRPGVTVQTTRQGMHRAALEALARELFCRLPPFSAADTARHIDALVDRALLPKPESLAFGVGETSIDFDSLPPPGAVPALLKQAEKVGAGGSLPDELRAALLRLRDLLDQLRYYAGYGQSVPRIDRILGTVQEGTPDAGEPWADQVRADLAAMPAAQRAAWDALLAHTPPGNQSKPSAKWEAQARKHLEAVGGESAFSGRAAVWLSLVGRKATGRIGQRNSDILRGLIWHGSLVDDATLCRAVGDAAEACFKTLPDGGGLLSSRTGRACLYTLGALPGLEPSAQLARLKLRVKSPWALEEIKKAFDEATRRAGLSEDDLMELSVPTFGLDGQGRLRQPVGDGVVEIAVAGTRHVSLRWLDRDGAAHPDIPAAVRNEHGEAIKALQRAAGAIEKMLPAQRDRIERLLRSERSWDYTAWRERYLDHPLLANLARRLIWHFETGERGGALGIWHDGHMVGEDGRPLVGLGDRTRVQLWHPAGFDAAVVLRWRLLLEAHQVSQPFKQAHREVYLLTDAELATGTYSNRFAGHILRQHQFQALCRQRGWAYDYLGTWDGGNGKASLLLPGRDLRAEFWVDAGGDEEAAAGSGVMLHVATDQVRFCRPDDDTPLPLADVPHLVFSEVLRDVDLFVGVASVGNDPAWRDRGEGAYRDYWQDYAFGDLSASARTRHDVLQRLLPRLKIRDRCTLGGKFLVVRGDLRTYKIHLGSANILMEPNDQYLCIVPGRDKDARADAGMFLPFEGDGTLSVILSKAFLLADDAKITDRSILSQIRQGTIP